MSIFQFSLNIVQWNIVCNKKLHKEDWCKGDAHWTKSAVDFEAFSPKLEFFPPLKRRRLSPSARLFFESAWYLLDENKDIPVVYASSNGETNRNFALWHSLLTENALSPTSFSLSVHNALVGHWSELAQVQSEMTALTAQKNNLEIALLEAYLLLNDGASRVLVVVAESPVEMQYNAQPLSRQPFAYALSLLVEKGENYQLTLTENPQPHTQVIDSALEWVKNQHLELTQWQTPSHAQQVWQWQKN